MFIRASHEMTPHHITALTVSLLSAVTVALQMAEGAGDIFLTGARQGRSAGPGRPPSSAAPRQADGGPLEGEGPVVPSAAAVAAHSFDVRREQQTSDLLDRRWQFKQHLDWTRQRARDNLVADALCRMESVFQDYLLWAYVTGEDMRALVESARASQRRFLEEAAVTSMHRIFQEFLEQAGERLRLSYVDRALMTTRRYALRVLPELYYKMFVEGFAAMVDAWLDGPLRHPRSLLFIGRGRAIVVLHAHAKGDSEDAAPFEQGSDAANPNDDGALAVEQRWLLLRRQLLDGHGDSAARLASQEAAARIALTGLELQHRLLAAEITARLRLHSEELEGRSRLVLAFAQSCRDAWHAEYAEARAEILMAWCAQCDVGVRRAVISNEEQSIVAVLVAAEADHRRRLSAWLEGEACPLQAVQWPHARARLDAEAMEDHHRRSLESLEHTVFGYSFEKCELSARTLLAEEWEWRGAAIFTSVIGFARARVDCVEGESSARDNLVGSEWVEDWSRIQRLEAIEAIDAINRQRRREEEERQRTQLELEHEHAATGIMEEAWRDLIRIQEVEEDSVRSHLVRHADEDGSACRRLCVCSEERVALSLAEATHRSTNAMIIDIWWRTTCERQESFQRQMSTATSLAYLTDTSNLCFDIARSHGQLLEAQHCERASIGAEESALAAPFHVQSAAMRELAALHRSERLAAEAQCVLQCGALLDGWYAGVHLVLIRISDVTRRCSEDDALSMLRRESSLWRGTMGCHAAQSAARLALLREVDDASERLRNHAAQLAAEARRLAEAERQLRQSQRAERLAAEEEEAATRRRHVAVEQVAASTILQRVEASVRACVVCAWHGDMTQLAIAESAALS